MDVRKSSRAAVLRVAVAGAALACAAVACGPSLQNVHEGAVRFEHCNRLDLDEHVAKRECKKCWDTWLSDYTYGQPRDRIDYARRRTRALANGGDSRPVLKIDEHAPEARQFYLVVPGPTSVRTPPPPIATVWKDADAGALAKTASESPPAESCADDCRTAWQSCGPNCSNGKSNGHSTNGNGNGAAKPNGNGTAKPNGSGTAKPNGSGASAGGADGCTKCRSDYSACMKRCFE